LILYAGACLVVFMGIEFTSVFNKNFYR